MSANEDSGPEPLELFVGQEVPLTARIRAQLPGLQPAMRRVGEYIVRNPSRAAGLTISALAREVDTSETTVIRFCREMNLSGYSELRLKMATEIGGRSKEDIRLEESGDISEGDDVVTAISKIAYTDARSVSDTVNSLSLETLAAVSGELARASRVEAYGIGASGLSALDLQQKLHRIGRICFAFTDPHLAFSSASLLKPGMVAVGFSNSGRTVEIVEWLAAAKKAGATTVVITNTPGSPVVEQADYSLFTVARETNFRAGATGSRLAQLTLVDCLFVATAQHTFRPSVEALEGTRAAIQQLQELRAGR
ncbi:MurR/RpiR family transcriptional regulator [Actinomyces minihominis]|uniref:MurR/RpiR family transcriptional regulator n=1 Tax=Actinomyces minihominis TaxID=2002838 RepID=UPI001A90D8F7|nr:MurR/RpiR family transcriptional regulator [Actinomyces minihominis]